MSVWTGSTGKITAPLLQARKHPGAAQRDRIAAVTAYDFPTARLADAAGVDLVLVGDSLAMTMLGHADTLSVTVDEMLVFTRAARRGLKRALLVADMPFGSYQVSVREGLRHALRFVKEAGAEAVKIEGGQERARLVRRLTEAQIPVLGHLGLTPQSVHRMGGYKVQAKTVDAIDRLRADAQALAEAGCFAVVLEGIPREVAAVMTAELPVPTIGIGAGPECDGQVLVWHDLLGIDVHAEGVAAAKFVRRYMNAGRQMQAALECFCSEVRAGVFPAEAESYHLSRETREALSGMALADPAEVEHAGA